MLGYEELNEVARLKRLSPANAERDYLQELILFTLYGEVGPELVFKGGTCLYKLHKLSRFSEDLDFTADRKADVEEAVRAAVDRLKFLGVSGEVKNVKRSGRETNIRLLFRGPLYRGSRESLCFIPLNVSTRERAILGPERSAIRPMYRDIPSFDVFSMRVEEIMAEKVRAVLTRRKPRDVHDLWFLRRNGVRVDPKLVNRKLSAHKIKFDEKKFLERVERMSGLWRIDLKNLVLGGLPDFGEVKREVAGIFTS